MKDSPQQFPVGATVDTPYGPAVIKDYRYVTRPALKTKLHRNARASDAFYVVDLIEWTLASKEFARGYVHATHVSERSSLLMWERLQQVNEKRSKGNKAFMVGLIPFVVQLWSDLVPRARITRPRSRNTKRR